MKSFAVGILLALVFTAAGQSCRCEELEDNGYLFCSCKKSWEQAKAYCADSYQGQLALITSDSVQDTVRGLLDANSASDTWIGARGEVGDWRWIHDGRPISYQGCYQDDPNSRDLSFDIGLGLEVTPQKCIEECKKAGYRYAALQSGSLCMCGNSYGRYGFSSSCSDPCLGDFNQNCGGALSNQVYRTEAGDASGWVSALDSSGWAFGSPSSGSGNVDDKECMVYKCEQFYGWTWQNEKCERKFKYMCMFDYDNSTCTARRLTPTAETCIGYSETEESSWFIAAEKCRSKGGRLLEVTSPLSHYAIRDALKDRCWLDTMWIGATKVEWKWTSGAPLRYTKWATAMPQNEGHKCIAMSYRVSFEYEWSDLPCDNPQSFVCQKPSIPVVTVPTTTRRSTTPTTTTTSTTTIASTTSTTPSTTTTTTTASTTKPTTRTTTTIKRTTSTRPSTTSTARETTTMDKTRTPMRTIPPVEMTSHKEKSSTVSASTLSTISSTRTRKPGVVTPRPPIPALTDEPGVPPGEATTRKSGQGTPKPPVNTPMPTDHNGTSSFETQSQPADRIPMYVGIALAIALFLVIVAAIIYCCCKKYRRRKEKVAQTKVENGYTNRAGFVHDGDFAYANVTQTTPKNGISNGAVVDNKRNGFERSTYNPVNANNQGDTPINIVPPTNVVDADKRHDDVPDNMTSTVTSASSEVGQRDPSDASSVNSASSAYIGELDDQGVSVQYVHPRDEMLDQSNQPTLPREQAYNNANVMTDDSRSSTLYPGSNDSLIKTNANDSSPVLHKTTLDFSTRL